MAACWTCGGPTTTPRHHYCDWCRTRAERRRDRRGRVGERANTTARGYGSAHQRARKKWAVLVEAGEVCCWRCGRLIVPGTAWDMGHDDDDRSLPALPEHAYRCNRAAAGRKAHGKVNARSATLDASRAW